MVAWMPTIDAAHRPAMTVGMTLLREYLTYFAVAAVKRLPAVDQHQPVPPLPVDERGID
jgi:hypothetical protein